MKKILIVLVALLVACSERAVAPDAPFVGRYALKTVNAQPVPTDVVKDSTGTVTVLSGVVLLRADSSFSDILTVKIAQTGYSAYVSADTLTGYYTRDGSAIHLASGYFSYVMEWQGTSLTEILGGQYVLVYQK